MGTLSSYLPNIPSEIVTAIENEFQALASRFSRHDWGPAELNGARFAEGMFRYLEWKHSGTAFTPIGVQLNRQSIFNRVSTDANLPDGLRFHVLKCTELLLDIRNKRNVAHLGNLLNVDEMDSRLVMRLVKWILAEVIREESAANPQEIQRIIDSLSVKEIPLIEEIDGDLVVVGTDLKADQRALIVLYHYYPKPVAVNGLREVIKYKNPTRFREEILEEKAKAGIIHIKGDKVFLTTKGCAWIEKNIDMHLEV
jgi:hypothetical protein